MATIRDRKETSWWARLWLVFAFISVAVVGAGLYWRYDHRQQEFERPAISYTSVKIATATVDGRSIAATVDMGASPAAREVIEKHREAIANELSSFMTATDSKVLLDLGERENLLKSIRRKVNSLLPEGTKVDKVYFSNYVVGS